MGSGLDIFKREAPAKAPDKNSQTDWQMKENMIVDVHSDCDESGYQSLYDSGCGSTRSACANSQTCLKEAYIPTGSIITEEDPISRLPKMTEVFRPLIVDSVLVSEILPYMSLQVDKSRLLCIEKSSTKDAVSILLDEIIASEEPGKWTMFLDALKRAGYEYVAKLLIGETEKDLTVHRKLLQIFTPYIVENLDPKDVTDILFAKDLISMADKEEIENKQRYNNTSAATLVLLDRIPRRKDNWLAVFLVSLRECGYEFVADEINIQECIPSSACKAIQYQSMSKPKPCANMPATAVSRQKSASNEEARSQGKYEEAMNKDCALKLETNLQKQKSIVVNDYLTPQQNLIKKCWIKEDELFVETAASKFVYKQVEENEVTTITGVPGAGKTFMARYTALKMQSFGWTVVPISSIDQIVNDRINPKLQHVYVLDDVVGSEGIDNARLAVAERYDDFIVSLLSQSKMKIVFTCRKQIVQDKDFLRAESVVNKNIIDVNEGKFLLTEFEKQEMLQNHSNNAKQTTSKVIVESLSDLTCKNFPLLCKLFVSNGQYRERGIEFFKNPFPVIAKEIERIEYKDKLKYFCLVLCLMFDNAFHEKNLDEDNKKVKQVMKACGIPNNTLTKNVKAAMQSLMNVYLIKQGTQISFIHDTLYEAVAYSFGKDYPVEMLEHCSPAFIREHVNVIPSADAHYVFIEPSYYQLLSERLVRDITDGYFHDVVFGTVMQHDDFLTQFITYLNTFNDEDIIQLFFNTSVNLEVDIKYTIDENIWTRIFSAYFILAEKDVKCIHFLLARNVSAVVKFCFTKLDTVDKAILKDKLIPAACLGGNVDTLDTLNFILQNEYTGHFGEIWYKRNMPVLQMAVLSGNAQMVEEVLKHTLKDSVDNIDTDGWTPLKVAAQNGLTDIAQLLLQKGANVNLRSNDGWTALKTATKHGHKDIVKLMLQHGADVTLRDNDGFSALTTAAFNNHKIIAKMLLQYDADPNLGDKVGWTPLMTAAHYGHTEIVHMFLLHGGDVNLKSKNGWTPIKTAARNGRKDTLELLLQHGADINIKCNNGWTPLKTATRTGQRGTAELLLHYGANVNLGDNDGRSPLTTAAANGLRDIAELLLQYGASIDLQSRNGWTPLMTASFYGQKDILQLLLQHGADANIKSRKSWTPLKAATLSGHIQLAELLLQYGADVNSGDSNDWTPLTVAAFSGHRDIAELLLQCGANVNAEEKGGWAPLVAAAFTGQTDTGELLLQNQAKVDAKSDTAWISSQILTQNCLRDAVEMLQTYDLEKRYQKSSEWTALMTAVFYGHSDIVELLLQHKADASFEDNNGWSPLMIAAQNDHRKIAELLINHGANVNQMANNGRTAFSVAKVNGHRSLEYLLLQNGADV